jgi:hypothetical protein
VDAILSIGNFSPLLKLNKIDKTPMRAIKKRNTKTIFSIIFKSFLEASKKK